MNRSLAAAIATGALVASLALPVSASPTTVVETEGAFMQYINGQTTTKPKFLPNGDNYSMRHTYYNEWLINLVPAHDGGDHGHADPVNEAVKTSAANGDSKCLKCHSGLGFLNRIGARAPTGTRIFPTLPAVSLMTTAHTRISCMICHTRRVQSAEGGRYRSMRKWGNGKDVSCGDCHNWQFEMLDQPVQYETIAGVEYTRPAANTKSRHPQREMVTGGRGGEDGLGGLWGVAPMDTAMPDTTCKDCHMPRTSKEGMPANDDGSPEATHMSHRFHVVLPGDAIRWRLRPKGDSCVTDCHAGTDVESYTRADMQAWIDQKKSAVANASAAATTTLNAVALDLGLTDWNSFVATQPTSGDASALPAVRWAMLQHAAQNADFVVEDASGGIHNPAYALAGLAKARLWAASADCTLDATLDAGPAVGDGMSATGSLLGFSGAPIPDAEVVLETSTNGTTWTTVCSGDPDAAGAFSLPTGPIVGSRSYRVRFSPSEGVDYLSALMPVAVPVTTASVTPAGATSAWLDIPSAQVTMSATPGAITYYTLSGATVMPQTVYLGTITLTGEGKTTVTFWSTDGNGTEAARTLPVMIDRGTPAVYSDLASVYPNKAVVHAWATDGGAGVDSMHYAFGTSDESVDRSGFTFETYKLGKNNLVVSATDSAGKTSSRTLAVWVKATPSLTMSPSTTKRISRGRSVTFSTRVTRGKDGAGNDIMLTGRPLVMQRWSGRKWYTWATFNTGTGTKTWTKKFTGTGTSYWRWAVPADAYSYKAYSKTLKVVVK